jgi:hypothetical protein
MKASYVIAIPSYKREHALKTHTLRCLRYIPLEQIYIFVANDQEYDNYKTVLPDYQIVVGQEGLVNQRNFISKYFPIDTKIVSIDDDIQEFIIKKDDKLEIIDDIDIFFKEGFNTLEKENAHLFGFYPVLNKLFMKETITTDFRFIIGSCFGYINSHIYLTLSEKDDYQRSILYFLRDKKVVRFNYISMKTKYYKMKGGLQSISCRTTSNSRKQEQEKAVKYLIETYPDYFAHKKSFKSGFPELRTKV